MLRGPDGGFVEGSYDTGRFNRFDEILDFLRPAAFAIETDAPDLDRRIAEFPAAILTSVQASRRAILSQIYSVGRADLLRCTYERTHGPSDVVFKLRFDLNPVGFVMDEIDYILAHPETPVIFAPTPHAHVHPGGGAGCRACQAFFDQNHEAPDFDVRLSDFLAAHGRHSNDICDLHAIASPASMSEYTRALDKSAEIYQQVLLAYKLTNVRAMGVEPDRDEPRDLRVVGGGIGFRSVEHAPFFYPEKLIRFGTGSQLVLDGRSVFRIHRS